MHTRYSFFLCTTITSNLLQLQTCIYTATSTTYLGKLCQGSTTAYAGFVLPTTYYESYDGGNWTIIVPDNVMYAPLFQLNWREADRSVQASSTSTTPSTGSSMPPPTPPPTPPLTPSPTPTPPVPTGLSPGAKAGIGVGISVTGLAAVGCILWWDIAASTHGSRANTTYHARVVRAAGAGAV